MSGPGEPRPEPAPSWAPVVRPTVECPSGPHRGPGTLDESVRRLDHSEFGAALALVDEGHQVRSQPNRAKARRIADVTACGVPVEVKGWLSLEERGGRVPTPQSVYNRLIDSNGQADTTVLWAKGTGLAEVEARTGVERFASSGRSGSVTTVRVLGDGFDMTWARGPTLAPVTSAPSPGSQEPSGADPAERHPPSAADTAARAPSPPTPEHRRRRLQAEKGPDLGL